MKRQCKRLEKDVTRASLMTKDLNFQFYCKAFSAIGHLRFRALLHNPTSPQSSLHSSAYISIIQIHPHNSLQVEKRQDTCGSLMVSALSCITVAGDVQAGKRGKKDCSEPYPLSRGSVPKRCVGLTYWESNAPSQ